VIEAVPMWIWVVFNLGVLGMLALDLGVFHRKAHEVSLREATIWSVVWVSLALLFNLFVYFWRGEQAGLEFLTGYLIEKSLSVDNIFVFALLFSYFAVPAKYQHRVLFWGILGALLMRGILIAVGAQLIAEFHWIIYLFGAFLVITGIKMALLGDQKLEPERNPVVRLVRRLIPITSEYRGQQFLVREADASGRLRWFATPLFLVLVMVETTDLVFAVDSIPAIFAVTLDPFIVYTSNVFAILGLRSLYFLLAGVMDRFVYLKPGLAAVLVFVGAKMLLVDVYKVPIGISLAVIGGILAIAIGLSLWSTRGRIPAAPPPTGTPSSELESAE
jgi:tellurite resistance protein TerC